MADGNSMLRQLVRLALPIAYWLLRWKWRITRPITVGVRMMIVREQQILLVKQTYHPGWQLPGGKVDRGESAEQAAIRETAEETGIRCGSNNRLLGLYTKFDEGKSDHVAVFVASEFEAGPVPRTLEIADRQWFQMQQLPGETTPGTRRRISEYLEGASGRAAKW